ncbi:MAG: LEA type 2 family protein [Acidobacteriota bacterium]|nr:LEA type 2 family protein [Acidobacteriota bacterium]
MRHALIVASLALMCGCGIVDPAETYRAAARQLRFSLERVEPKVELAFPLNQSRIRFRFDIEVRNDSDLRLHARGLDCKLSLHSADQINAIGDVGLPGGFDVPAKGRASVPLELALTYRDLQTVWRPIMDVVQGHKAAAWKLDGTAKLEALGIGFDVPIHSTKNANQ